MEEKEQDQLESLLANLSAIECKYSLKREGEELFNIFTVLCKEHDEVRLHSRFLAALLSPQSSHKMAHTFLELFLQTVNIAGFDCDQAEVYPTEYSKKEYKNIDIFIVNRTRKQAIIIENKIWAGDSNHEDRGQLEGYFNRILQEDHILQEDIHVFYLTLDGHKPSLESLGAYQTLEAINGRCISYEHEIQVWLGLCLKETAVKPILRDSIHQYLKLIRKMTDDNTLTQEVSDITNIIAQSPANMKSAKLLIDNFRKVKRHTVKQFWDELAGKLTSENYKIYQEPSDEDITSTIDKSSNRDKNDYGIRFTITEGLALFIWNGISDDDDPVYWGWQKDGHLSDAYELRLLKQFDSVQLGGGSKNYFHLKHEEDIYLFDFTHEGTFNLIDPAYRTMMIEKLVNEIKQVVKDIT
jgi:hypothetical protein